MPKLGAGLKGSSRASSTLPEQPVDSAEREQSARFGSRGEDFVLFERTK